MQTENNQRLNDLKRMKAKLGKKKEIEKQRNERIERQLLVADNAATESKDLNEVNILHLGEIYGLIEKMETVAYGAQIYGVFLEE